MTCKFDSRVIYPLAQNSLLEKLRSLNLADDSTPIKRDQEGLNNCALC